MHYFRYNFCLIVAILVLNIIIEKKIDLVCIKRMKEKQNFIQKRYLKLDIGNKMIHYASMIKQFGELKFLTQYSVFCVFLLEGL